MQSLLSLTVLAYVAAHVRGSTLLDSALDHASKHTALYDKDLLELAAIPSISSLPENSGDVEKAAAWLSERLTDAGLEVRFCIACPEK
jgi:hypothetical protein